MLLLCWFDDVVRILLGVILQISAGSISLNSIYTFYQEHSAMKLYKNILSAVAVLCALVLPAHADDDQGLYLGMGYAATDVNDDNFDDSIGHLGLRGGYMFTNNIGIDLTGFMTSDSDDGNVNAEVGIWAVSGIGSVPLGEYFDLYGKLGAARVVTKSTIGDSVFYDDSSTEFFWAVGGEVDFGMVNLFLEYNRFDTDAVDINTAMAGIKLEF